jgi:hypothetical protein
MTGMQGAIIRAPKAITNVHELLIFAATVNLDNFQYMIHLLTSLNGMKSILS